MKVLLTGASGFVGSHILDSLCTRGIPAAILLRPSSNRRFIQDRLASVEVRTGSITEPRSLYEAMAGVTHVIHCAGATRACRNSEFYEINHAGTRNVVDAVNAQPAGFQRFLHISSLAVTGPATPARPAREDDPLEPVSEYGKSKLAAELEVRAKCQKKFVILRPPAVYGPRDDGFVSIFKAVKLHILPRLNSGQALSLVYATDLAEAVVNCLTHPAAAGRTYFVSSREIASGRKMADEIAAQMKSWTVPCPVPTALLWPVCLAQELLSRVTGKASLLNLQKFAELRAPGWVCDPSLFEQEIGCKCGTTLPEGIGKALTWYRDNRWL